jgi:hypothetical protein
LIENCSTDICVTFAGGFFTKRDGLAASKSDARTQSTAKALRAKSMRTSPSRGTPRAHELFEELVSTIRPQWHR